MCTQPGNTNTTPSPITSQRRLDVNAWLQIIGILVSIIIAIIQIINANGLANEKDEPTEHLRSKKDEIFEKAKNDRLEMVIDLRAIQFKALVSYYAAAKDTSYRKMDYSAEVADVFRWSKTPGYYISILSMGDGNDRLKFDTYMAKLVNSMRNRHTYYILEYSKRVLDCLQNQPKWDTVMNMEFAQLTSNLCETNSIICVFRDNLSSDCAVVDSSCKRVFGKDNKDLNKTMAEIIGNVSEAFDKPINDGKGKRCFVWMNKISVLAMVQIVVLIIVLILTHRKNNVSKPEYTDGQMKKNNKVAFKDLRAMESNDLYNMYSVLMQLAETIIDDDKRMKMIKSLRLSRARLAVKSKLLPVEIRMKEIMVLREIGKQSDVEYLKMLLNDPEEDDDIKNLAIKSILSIEQRENNK